MSTTPPPMELSIRERLTEPFWRKRQAVLMSTGWGSAATCWSVMAASQGLLSAPGSWVVTSRARASNKSSSAPVCPAPRWHASLCVGGLGLVSFSRAFRVLLAER